ncbi:MAG: M14 family metallopeptidase [Luteimonas sp.]
MVDLPTRSSTLIRICIPALLPLCLLSACASITPPPERPETDTTAVVLQERREWAFIEDGMRFDNRLPGARLTDVMRKGPRHYAVVITPETRPINPSPWYGFRVAADRPGPLRIDFHYPDYQHRYHPKLDVGDGRWREATAAEFSPEQGDQPARLQVEIGPRPLRVFAQPPLLPDDFDTWIETIGTRLPIERSVFGHSVQGQPLQLFEFGGNEDAPLLIVIGRQHPPENTGSQALFGFVETLAGNTPQARAFRDRVRTVVVPLVNPDGIVEGHWRTNLHGKDLNRDWGPFEEPETRALAHALLARSEDAGRPVVFALDFHSTFRDVMYTVEEDPARQPDGALGRWISALRAHSPELAERPSAATSTVFKNWAYCRFGAPTVTYEVGDTTPEATLDTLSRLAAVALMTVLDETVVNTPVRIPPCAAAHPG